MSKQLNIYIDTKTVNYKSRTYIVKVFRYVKPRFNTNLQENNKQAECISKSFV